MKSVSTIGLSLVGTVFLVRLGIVVGFAQIPPVTLNQTTATPPTTNLATSPNVPSVEYSIYKSNGTPKTAGELLEERFSHPMEFYGKVLDENDLPVSGVSIDFEWINAKGEQFQDAKLSDAHGLFSVNGLRGKSLNVSLSKEGYYFSAKQNQTSFEYAFAFEPNFYHPDPSNPVVFRVRKKGPGADLITSQNGISTSMTVQIPRNGTPIKVDFPKITLRENDRLIVSQDKPEYKNWKTATEWSFKMEIPDGGFLEYTNEFPFEAPRTGYQSVVNFDYKTDQPGWATAFKKSFYIVFGNPPRYGRMEIQTDIMWSNALLTYAINPSGSRYLEPK